MGLYWIHVKNRCAMSSNNYGIYLVLRFIYMPVKDKLRHNHSIRDSVCSCVCSAVVMPPYAARPAV